MTLRPISSILQDAMEYNINREYHIEMITWDINQILMTLFLFLTYTHVSKLGDNFYKNWYQQSVYKHSQINTHAQTYKHTNIHTLTSGCHRHTYIWRLLDTYLISCFYWNDILLVKLTLKFKDEPRVDLITDCKNLLQTCCLMV